MLQCYIADRGEREYSDQQTNEGVYERNGDGVHQDRVVEFVVTREAYHRSEGDAHGIEDLRRGVYPHLTTNDLSKSRYRDINNLVEILTRFCNYFYFSFLLSSSTQNSTVPLRRRATSSVDGRRTAGLSRRLPG